MTSIDLRNEPWRKSSHSGDSGNCIEIKNGLLRVVLIRDSKNHTANSLSVDSRNWRYFLDRIKGV